MMKEKMFLCAYFAKVAKLLPESFPSETSGAKTVCYIPTASRVEKVNFFVGTSKKALLKLGLTINELEISTASPKEIADKIKTADIIFVEGGNSFFLLQELKRTGTDVLIKKHIKSGKLYIGASAGAMVVSPNIDYVKLMDTPKKAPDLHDDFSALGLTDFSVLPHFNNAPFKAVGRKIVATYAQNLDLKPLSNHQAIVVQGDVLKEIESKK